VKNNRTGQEEEVHAGQIVIKNKIKLLLAVIVFQKYIRGLKDFEGIKELAIENYTKVLALNPKINSAKKIANLEK
jgi:hypothetical protein